ncbi:hypothetical protein [Nocardia gipuzkoensis]
MNELYPRFELLASHLDSQFGNIYEFNLPEACIASYDGQAWTEELRAAVRQYLATELPGRIRDRLLDVDRSKPLEAGDLGARIDDLMALQPWEVALAVRNAAVEVAPSLHELIGKLEDWPSEDERRRRRQPAPRGDPRSDDCRHQRLVRRASRAMLARSQGLYEGELRALSAGARFRIATCCSSSRIRRFATDSSACSARGCAG